MQFSGKCLTSVKLTHKDVNYIDTLVNIVVIVLPIRTFLQVNFLPLKFTKAVHEPTHFLDEFQGLVCRKFYSFLPMENEEKKTFVFIVEKSVYGLAIRLLKVTLSMS